VTDGSQADLAQLLHRLGLGPRLQHILLILIQNPQWEHDPNLERISFRVLDRGADAARITYRTESRERLGDVA
jgi:hypothetical protein